MNLETIRIKACITKRTGLPGFHENKEINAGKGS